MFKLTDKKGGDFELAPEGAGRAVCVDVTPLEKKQTEYGEKEFFKIVFELDPGVFGQRKEGGPFAVWSRNFTPSLNEKANLRKFLRQWFGRDLTPAELTELDPETFIGKSANVVITHNVTEKGEFADIVACTPYKGTDPLKPTGAFVRKKDKDTTKGAAGGTGGGSQFKKAEQPDDAGRDDWQKVKVHVGKHQGVQLGDLDEKAVTTLIEKWVPVAKAAPKMSADDKRLVAGLEAALAVLQGGAKASDEAPEEPPY